MQLRLFAFFTAFAFAGTTPLAAQNAAPASVPEMSQPATGMPEIAGPATPKPFGALDVFELEIGADPQISPDGKQIVYVRRSMDIMIDNARSNIWTIKADGTGHRPVLSGTGSYSSPRWSPSGDRIAYITAVEGKGAELFVRWMDTGQTAMLTNLPEAPRNIAWAPDGKSIAFAMFVADKPSSLATPPSKPEGAKWAPAVKVIDEVAYRFDGSGYARPGKTHLFTVPADGGTPRQLTQGPYNHNGGFDWAPDGSAIYFSANRNEDWKLDPVESNIFRIAIKDRKIQQLTRRKGPDASPRISPNGEMIAYLGYDDKRLGYHTRQVYTMQVDGSQQRPVMDNFDRQIDDLEWISNDKMVISYNDRGRTYLAELTIDGVRKPLVRDVSGLAIGRPYTSGDFSTNESGLIAYTTGRATRPADIAIVDLDRTATRLTRLNDDLLFDREMGKVERLAWQSSAGNLDIEGWLVKPPQFDPNKKYPLILEIHGGPFAAYGPHFSAEAQLYAAAGYVVLYTNPRGSTSYGAEFANEIHHAYPGKDYDDLISGVDAAIGLGFIDEDQLFVTGGSGGGVLTAWIIGKTNRFAAAAVAKPVINWISFALTADAYPFFYKYWFAQAPWENPLNYWERSPLSLVGNVETPTLLITGEADYRTPISETEQYYQALKLRGVEAAMVRVPEAPHSIARRPSHLIAKVGNILGWFEQYRDKVEE